MGNKDRGAADSQLDKQKSSASQISSTVILVVDDDQLQRLVFQTILSDEGYQIHVASSAEEALIVAQALNHHVVLTDLHMYKMDGIKLMEMLRSQKEAPEVIIMSALGPPCIIKESLAKGAFSFMEKPLETCELLYAINGAVEIAKIKAVAKSQADQSGNDVSSIARPLELER